MEKTARETVMAKFAEAMDTCPEPRILVALTTALESYVDGDSEEADRLLGELIGDVDYDD